MGCHMGWGDHVGSPLQTPAWVSVGATRCGRPGAVMAAKVGFLSPPGVALTPSRKDARIPPVLCGLASLREITIPLHSLTIIQNICAIIVVDATFRFGEVVSL